MTQRPEAWVPTPAAVRHLAAALGSTGFGDGATVSPESRGWWAAPRDLVRQVFLPEAAPVAGPSVRAARQLASLSAAAPAAACLFRLLTQGVRVPVAEVEGVVPAALLDHLTQSGLVWRDDVHYAARQRVVPLAGLTVITDFLRSRSALGVDYVQFGLDSAMLVAWIRAEGGTGRRALDLCTGGGVQALALAGQFASVEGVDVNPRAIALARSNAAAHDVEDRLHVRVGNLWEGATGVYDLIVANPPFMWLPPDVARTNLTGDGGAQGMAITMRILEGLASHLASDGRAFVYAQAPRLAGRCVLVEAARTLTAHTALAIEFEEILWGYWGAYRAFYRAQGVERITCYRIRVRRAAVGVVTVRPLTGWRAALAHAVVRLERGA